MKLNQFKHELRGNYKSDKWGEVMAAWFECAAHLRWRNKVAIPNEWQYSQGAGLDPRDKESYYFSLFRKATDKQLLTIGNYLHRLSKCLEKAGLSY